MDQTVDLVKRHGSHTHVNAANLFTLVVLIVIGLYSLLEIVNAKYKRIPRVMKICKSPLFLTVVWGLLCAWGILHHLNSDIKQIARRYGQLSIAMATLSIFISMKPAIMPYTYQTSLVSLHKWIGRSSILCATIHGIIYIYSYVKKESASSSSSSSSSSDAELHGKRHEGHSHKLFSLFNVFGMICLIAFLAIFISSLGKVRRASYAVFYMLHKPLVILIYVLMVWHARPSSWLLVPMGLIFLLIQLALRLIMSKRIHVSEVKSFGPSLKVVTFDPPISHSMLRGPGSHVRISVPLYYPTSFFRSSHPYSLIGNNKLVVRESRFKLVDGNSYSLYGPFSSSFNPENYTHVVVFAGGSGVSLLPSFAHVGSKRKFVWITRLTQEMPVLSEINVDECDVYITRTHDPQDNIDVDEGSYELEEFEIGSDSEPEASGNIDDEQMLLERDGRPSNPGIRRFPGRPNLSKVIDSFYGVQTGDKSNLCIVACGPEQLVSDISEWARSKNYDLWTEVFAL